MTSEPSAHQGAFSTQQLVDLVLNPRDPGYEAARQRPGPRSSRRVERVLAVIGCALAGFVLAVAYVHTNRGAPQAAKVHSSLVARVRAAEQRDNQLAAAAQRLNAQINTVRNQAIGDSALAGELTRAQLLAGEVAVDGPGLQVVLTEPPLAPSSAAPTPGGDSAPAAGNILTDRDVRSVVNQLWADGAEAISVNNVRLTPTSAIRFAGDAILVDFAPVVSPYTVRAIGDPANLDTRFAASAVASRYQTLKSADGIGFSFSVRGRLTLPASTADTLRYAHLAKAAK
jgi:uncharacterized protein YlxW (UPF0749 family)